MPLQRQIVALPLVGGIDTKTDQKQVAMGKLAELENGTFGTLKQLRKRNGYTALPRKIATASGFAQLESPVALTGYQDELLAVARSSVTPAESRLFSYADGAESWVDKGAFTPCDIETAPVVNGTVQRRGGDSTTLASGLQVYAWEEFDSTTSTPLVRYAAVDTSSGQLVLNSGLVATNASKPRVVNLDESALVYFMGGDGRLYVSAVYPSLGVSIGAPVVLTAASPGTTSTLSTVAAKQNWDVRVQTTVDGPRLFLVFANDAGGITLRVYASSAIAVQLAQQVLAGYSPDVVTVTADTAGVLVTFGVGPLLYTAATDGQLLNPFPALPTLVVGGVIAATCVQVGTVSVDAAGGSSRFRTWATWRDNAIPLRVFTIVLAHDTGTSSSAGYIWSTALVSQPWVFQGRAFAALAYVSRTTGAVLPLQNQVVVVSDATPVDVVARVFYGTADGARSTFAGGASHVASAVTLDGSSCRVAVMESGTVAADLGDLRTITGVSSMVVDFQGAPLVDNRSTLGGSLVLGGGLASQYDGASVVELGFLVWPDEVTVAVSGTGGGLSAGQYQWVAVYEWTDQQGLLHRSAPSLPVTATATSGQDATLTVSNLSLTKKQGTRNPVQVVLYRTTANGTLFYRASSLSAPSLNQPGNFTQNIADTLTDADLAKRPVLYTTGGVVENIPPGAIRGLTVHRGRLFAVDASNPLRVWFTRQEESGAPAEFSDTLFLDVDARGGPVVALASLDDKLVIFKRTLVMIVAGQGPDATGGANDFSDSVLVTTDAGCLDARSIVTVPDGLVFQSAKGIYLLNRSLQAQYIGADVERFNADTVESSQLIPTANQVRFLLSSGVALVFDYFVAQWAVFTNHPAVDTVVWLDRFCYLRTDGTVMLEDSTRHDDDGAFIPLKFTTGWLTFSTDAGGYVVPAGRVAPTLQGFQRAYRVLVLGEYAGAHQLRVRVAFDYQNAEAQDVRITEPTIDAPDAYGNGTPYGSESPFGGVWQLYQWRVDLARQKCQAVRFTVNDELKPGTEPGEGVRLSALALDVGLKPGATRVPMTQVVG